MITTFDIQFQRYAVNQAEVRRAVWEPQGSLLQRFRRSGRNIVTAARAQVGKDTRELARSIHYNIRRWNGLPELWVGSYNSIALLHHQGTRPHAIRARQGAFLRYSSKGRIVYAHTVMHPGTKPNRYLTDNLYLARL